MVGQEGNMSDQREDQWPYMLKAEFGRYVEDHEYLAWLSTIKRNLGGTVGDHEICNAIQAAAENHWSAKHTPRNPITASNVVWWIRRCRTERERIRETEIHSAELRRIKSLIDAETDPAAIWHLICSADYDKNCDKLETYAFQAKGFHRDQVPPEDRSYGLKELLEEQTVMVNVTQDRDIVPEKRLKEVE